MSDQHEPETDTVNRSEIQKINLKIDRILFVIEGSSHMRGVVERLDRVEQAIDGSSSNMGLIAKVNFMWRAHTWIIGGLGTIVGSLITFAATRILKP